MSIIDNPYLKSLNDSQKLVCEKEENILLTACPGSGKTRTLISKIAYLLNDSSTRKLIIAITYTNIAANEMYERLEKLNLDISRVWIGTIHAFCLEFIIKHNKMYDKRTKQGYSIIDEYVSNKYIKEIVNEHGLTKEIGYGNPLAYKIVSDNYYKKLEESKQLDFNQIVEISYSILLDTKSVASNLAMIIDYIMIDEYQDTQETQFKIMAMLFNKNKSIKLLFVGDSDQAIYGSIGGVVKNKDELEKLFETEIHEYNLEICYRSPQRIIDFYNRFSISKKIITASEETKDKKSYISYNYEVTKDDLIDMISDIIDKSIKNGVDEKDICILAPTWWILYPLSRLIKVKLPNISFDAPDITPFKKDPLNPFYIITKIIYSSGVKNISKRKRYATELMKLLQEEYNLFTLKTSSLEILDLLNASLSNEKEGIVHLENSIKLFFEKLDIDISKYKKLETARDNYLEKVSTRISQYDIEDSTDYFYKCFYPKKGIVINSFHGVKGEEYKVVIAFGLREGIIPNWNLIINESSDFTSMELKRLIYVVCSRSMSEIHLFSEEGRTTRRGVPLEKTRIIRDIDFDKV